MPDAVVTSMPVMPFDSAQPVDNPREWTRAMLAADYEHNSYPFERLTLRCIRMQRAWHNQPGLTGKVMMKLTHIFKMVWLDCVVGAEIPPEVHIGPGIEIPHSMRGVMIHATSRIGARARIYHQVTIGARDDQGGPIIGDHVVIGAGAKVLGRITVADGTRVGANAVVVKDTQAGGTYVGTPAQLVRSRKSA